MPSSDPLRSGGYAIVMEIENASTIKSSEVGETLRALADQIGETLPADAASLPQMICGHAGHEGASSALLDGIRRERGPCLPFAIELRRDDHVFAPTPLRRAA